MGNSPDTSTLTSATFSSYEIPSSLPGISRTVYPCVPTSSSVYSIGANSMFPFASFLAVDRTLPSPSCSSNSNSPSSSAFPSSTLDALTTALPLAGELTVSVTYDGKEDTSSFRNTYTPPATIGGKIAEAAGEVKNELIQTGIDIAPYAALIAVLFGSIVIPLYISRKHK